MDVLVLGHDEVTALLPMREWIESMAEALAALARAEVCNPLRSIVRPPGASGLLGLMPAYRGGADPAYGLKAVCVFPDNPTRGLDAHQGAVLLLDGRTGELLAMLNASAVTAIRTAAVSGLATRLLAREDAGDLALLGSGVQARSHLEAMSHVRTLRRARVWSRRLERARLFVEEVAGKYGFPIEAVQEAERAVRGADLVVTATASPTPIIERSWLQAGTHINAVGSSVPSARELDTGTIAQAALFVDRRESTLNESGDYLFAMREGAIRPEHIRAEIGEVLVGSARGRRNGTEITVFKSLGLAIEDLAAAQHVYRKATASGLGRRVPF